MNKPRRYQSKRKRSYRKLLADTNNGLNLPSIDAIIAEDRAAHEEEAF